MKIDWATLEKNHEWAAWFLCEALSELDRQVMAGTGETPAPEIANVRDIDVTLTVDGTEVPFVEIVDYMACIRETEVVKKAREFLEEKMGTISRGINDVFDATERRLEERP